MNRDDIIRMGVEARLYSGNPRTPGTGNMIERRLEHFARLVAAAEREECAQVCQEKWIYTASGFEMADYIRARGDQPQSTHWEGCEEVHPECASAKQAGCPHCRHPLYAGIRCSSCGRWSTDESQD